MPRPTAADSWPEEFVYPGCALAERAPRRMSVSGVDVRWGLRAHRRSIGATARDHDESVRRVVVGRHLAAPTAHATEVPDDVGTGARETGAQHRCEAERGADVLGVHPRVVPERLDAVAERAVEIGGTGP